MYNKALSYSSISLYRKCPARWAHSYIDGNWEPAGKAAQRGTMLHQKLEDFFNGKTPYPSGNRDLAPWQGFMATLSGLNPVAEGKIAVDSSWNKVDFSSPEAYFRGVKDLHIEGEESISLFDWKSGRIYGDHVEQGKAYVALSPEYERYGVHFAYLDQPFEIRSWSYSNEDREILRRNLSEEIEVIRNAIEYQETPSEECRWCARSWRNGGKCTRAR